MFLTTNERVLKNLQMKLHKTSTKMLSEWMNTETEQNVNILIFGNELGYHLSSRFTLCRENSVP